MSNIQRLYSLRRKVGLSGKQGRKARIEFVQLAYRHGLVADIQRYALWDAGYTDLGPRTLDTCFEMGDADADEVVIELIRDARARGYVAAVRDDIGAQAFARWEAIADRQGTLTL